MASPITFNRRSFKIHNRSFVILSGSVHYIRQHPSTWSRIFQTFLDAGLNTLETYLFWSSHDRGSDPPDFSDRNDVFSFIQQAGEAGLHVILRMGPYVCAEVSYGGFPFRLREVPGIKFRTWNVPFMGEVETWVRIVAQELHTSRLMAREGGPVILVQLENEYSMVSEAYGDDGGKYLQWCADLQKELDFGVPAMMCYGAAEGVVETINAFYGHEEVAGHRKRHTDQPPVWTEAWTGWYDTWGAPHHVRSAEDLSYAVARFFAAGGAGVNYYMWAGGVNYGRDGMYLQITGYDYDAPVDQFGRMTTKGKHLARLHRVLKDVFEEPFLATEQDAQALKDVYRWGDCRFVCNDDEEDIVVDLWLENGSYCTDIKARSVHIVDKFGTCLYDTATIHPDDVVERGLTEVASSSTPWRFFKEELPKFSGVSDGRVVHVEDVPVEQLAMTKDTSDYAFYSTRIQGTETATLTFEAADVAHVYVDGVLVGGTEMPPWEDRWSNRWNQYEKEKGLRHSIEVTLEGEHELCIMTDALGLVKGDWQLPEGVGMEGEKKGLLSDISGVERISKWACVGGLAGEALLAEGIPFQEASGERQVPGWYSCEVCIKQTSESLVVDLGALGKGLLWVNDVLLGRFWDIPGTRRMNGFLEGSPVKQVGHGEPSQRYYHIPSWIIGDTKDKGFVLRLVLFVERGAPQDALRLFEG